MKKDYCTLWPDLWYGECCANHDRTASKISIPWLMQNLWLAHCVWATSYSPKNCDRWYKVAWGRYLVPSLMFLGTSTAGIFWRIHALVGR